MSMNSLLYDMTAPIKEEYDKFDEYFTDSMLTDVKLINSVVRRSVRAFASDFLILFASKSITAI